MAIIDEGLRVLGMVHPNPTYIVVGAYRMGSHLDLLYHVKTF